MATTIAKVVYSNAASSPVKAFDVSAVSAAGPVTYADSPDPETGRASRIRFTA
jgi:hypothetical protein